ncbi:MAG: hypothetical protein IJ849_08880 [Selenomonadaceae bacterium]|nr:hypothetical protein [Selenomonadaceae bacterium]
MRNWRRPLLYYAAAMLYIYTTYALSQGQTSPTFFGDTPLKRSLMLCFYTNSSVAVGFLAFAFSYERFPQTKIIRYLMAVVGAVCIPLTASAETTSLPILALVMLSVGYFAGGAHYITAMTIEAPWRGRFLGGAIALTVLVQYGLSAEGKEVPTWLLLGILAANVLLAELCFRQLGNALPRPSVASEDERRPPPSPRFLAMLMVMVATLAMLHGCGDCLALEFYAKFDESLFHDTVRLFFPVGIIIAGYVADLAQRRYLLRATAIALLLRVVSLVVTDTNEGFFLSQSAEYFVDSFCIMSYTLYFLDVAADSSRPSLWAGMGRTIALPVSAVSANVFGLIWADFSVQGFMAAYVLILALLNLFSYHGAFREWLEIPAYAAPEMSGVRDTPTSNLPTATPENASAEKISSIAVASASMIPAAMTEAKNIAAYKERFAFTDRETEVLTLILQEQTAAAIAEKLGIKERTARYHIANILRKTGTKHRAELRLLLSLTEV